MGEDLLMLREQTREDFLIPEVESDMEVEDADDDVDDDAEDAKEDADNAEGEVEEEVENDDNDEEEDEIEQEEEDGDDNAEMEDEEEDNMEEGEEEVNMEEEEKEREEKNDAQGKHFNVLQTIYRIQFSIMSLVFLKQRIIICIRPLGCFAPIFYFNCEHFLKKNIVKQNKTSRTSKKFRGFLKIF